MSDKHDDGGPAFACATSLQVHQKGMTLRDWFAGLAMQACAIGLHTNNEVKIRMHKRGGELGMDVIELVAKGSYQQADAMIAEKRKREQA